MRMRMMAAMLLTFAAAAYAAGPMDAPDLMPVTMRAAPKHAPVELVRDGKALAVVYVAAPAPSATLKTLVDELVETVKLSTGAELPVVTNAPAADQAAIIIGDCPESHAAGIDAAKLPAEGFAIMTAPNRVYLAGSTAAIPANLGASDAYANEGTAWAVSDFLERFVGVRWYWPQRFEGRTVVKARELVVPPADYTDAPVFAKRSHHPASAYADPWQSRWFDKQQPPPPAAFRDVTRVEMKRTLAGLRSGNHWPYLIKVHQPQWWADYDETIKKHPTLFALKADGTRSKGMLCYSSPETLAYLLKGCEDAWDKGKYGSAWVTELCLSLSPGDEPVQCQCADCRKLYEPNAPQFGATGGTASRLMALFVKRACEAVKQRWPDKKVIYLPYWNYAHCPEDIAFPDNLEIEFATTGFGGFREADTRRAIETEMRQWSKAVGGRITTWEYSCWIANWTHAPFQYPHLAQDYYRANRDVLAGSFINGGNPVEWSRNAPSLYVWLRVLWNPDIDVDATLDEMCNRLFGKGARTSRALLRLMCDRWEKAPWSTKLGANGRLDPAIFRDTWPPDIVADMDKLYRQAREEMKDDPVALARFDYWNWTFAAFVKEAKEVTAQLQKE